MVRIQSNGTYNVEIVYTVLRGIMSTYGSSRHRSTANRYRQITATFRYSIVTHNTEFTATLFIREVQSIGISNTRIRNRKKKKNAKFINIDFWLTGIESIWTFDVLTVDVLLTGIITQFYFRTTRMSSLTNWSHLM